MHTIRSEWKGKVAFDHHIQNHKIRTDSTPELGDDSGASPKRLLLASLAGCSGIDVTSMLQKMRVSFDSLHIEVEADQSEGHPVVYTEIRMVYHFRGKQINEEKVKRAVELSQTKYCGVTAMLQKNCPIRYDIVISEE